MKTLQSKQLAELAGALAAQGYRVVAPQVDGEVVRLMEWANGAAIEIARLPVNSAKDTLFPRSEIIGRYTFAGDEFTQENTLPQVRKTALLCVRPCDAAAIAVLDAVFNWDSVDVFYLAWREACTVIALACTACDENCFCTSVGGASDATKGADAILRPADGGSRLILEPLTDKGEQIAQAGRKILVDDPAQADPPAEVPIRFDAAKVTDWLGKNFDSPRWAQWSLACLGCGACAFACLTCHCFDIQDEATRAAGVRYRNWDACGLALFTLHTSGHNPRPNQAARWRQRVMHKFSYMPEKFQLVGCTGCGRCARVCGQGMAILEVCKAISE